MLIWIAWMANFSLKLEAIIGSGRKVGLCVISNWFLLWKSLKWAVKKKNIVKWCNLSHAICRCFPDLCVCVSGGQILCCHFPSSFWFPEDFIFFLAFSVKFSSRWWLTLGTLCNSCTKWRMVCHGAERHESLGKTLLPALNITKSYK